MRIWSEGGHGFRLLISTDRDDAEMRQKIVQAFDGFELPAPP